MRIVCVSRVFIAMSALMTLTTALPPSARGQQLSTSRLGEMVKDFNREFRSVRPDHPLLPVNYVEYSGTTYGYFLPRRFVRLAREGDRFRIRDRKLKKRILQFGLESKRGAKMNMTINAPDRLTQGFLDHVVLLVLSDLFTFGETRQAPRFIGNSDSRFVHLAMCNHLPAPEHRVGFPTREQAEAEGYKKCAVCFASEEVIPIEDYRSLRANAIERARIYELAFPPLDDSALQADIQALGDSILENFPIETRGFTYSFKVVHSQFANAVAFPTGFVFISDKLVLSAEDRAELKVVLAHEIAHVELGRFESRRTDYPPLLPDSYWQKLRFHETEADLLSIVYLWQNDARADAVQRASNALRKMEFESESVPEEKEDKYATHPSYAERYRFFDPQVVLPCRTRTVFCGSDENGGTVARVQMVAKGLSKYTGVGRETGSMRTKKAYLVVSTTDLVNDKARIAGGKIVDGTGHSFDLSQVVASEEEIGPDATILFEMNVAWLGSDDLDDSSIREIRLSGLDVKKWGVCSE